MSSNLQNAFNNLKELEGSDQGYGEWFEVCLLYTSPSPRDRG